MPSGILITIITICISLESLLVVKLSNTFTIFKMIIEKYEHE